MLCNTDTRSISSCLSEDHRMRNPMRVDDKPKLHGLRLGERDEKQS